MVFGIVFAAIVIGLLVFFGFKYISEIISISCESQTQQQLENLKNTVKSTLALSKGSVQEFKVVIQSNCAPKICFVIPDAPNAYPEGGWNPDEFTTYLVTRNGYNVLIFGKGEKTDGYAVDKLKQTVNFCLTSTREVMLRNNGKTVEITLPEF